jgi:hypothetical protein
MTTHLPPILQHLTKVVKISLMVKLKSNKGYFEAPSKPELGSSWLALITSGSHSNKYIRSVPSNHQISKFLTPVEYAKI